MLSRTQQVVRDGHVQGEWERLIPGNLNDTKFTNAKILENLKRASTLMQLETGTDFWTSDESQSELLRRIQADSKHPPTAPRRWGSSFCTGTPGLSPLDYTQASKDPIQKGSLGAVGSDEEWVEMELTADSGACDTVILRKTAESIPIMPSLASLRGMEYEVANGQLIPNLGERRCLDWSIGTIVICTEIEDCKFELKLLHK